ncbi:hypothetical protein TB1_009530 [Malus domestica]
MVGPKAADHKEAGPMATGPELPAFPKSVVANAIHSPKTGPKSEKLHAFPKSVVANAIHSPKTGPKSESYQTVAKWDWLKEAEWNSKEAD